MSNRFKDTLKKIRDDSAKRNVAGLAVRSEADLEKSARTVHAFEFRENIEKVIEEFVANFQAEAPSFVLTRGFFEGKYMLALRADEQLNDANGDIGTYFSRIMFLLDPHGEDDEFAMQCRRTVRNLDAETTSCTTPMVDDAKADLAAFIEQQFIDFAERYFAETELTAPASANS